jgi:Fic family protein
MASRCGLQSTSDIAPAVELESKAILKQCITARAALAELKQAAELIPNQGMLINTLPLLEARARRQAASRHLKALVEIGVLQEMQLGREKIFIHPKLMQLLTHDSGAFSRYP